jgi:general secretion pathway protein C
MELYLKRYFWTLPILMIVACAVLAALGANHIVEAQFLLGGEAPHLNPKHAKPKHDAQKPPPSKDAAEVVARNMFCSTCEPPKPVETASTPSAPIDENHPPTTTLPLALLATIVAENPSASGATILNTQSFKSGSYGVGDLIPGAGPVRRIHPKSVDFFNTTVNHLERVELLGTAGQPVAQNTATPPPQVTPQPAADPNNPDAELLAAVDKGVKRLDDTRYDIDRSLVDKILADPTAAARSARIVPSIKDGKPNGFKMYAIRPNSLFAKIGLQNGDTIQSINGMDMSSPDKALEVYTKVRSASNLSVSVLRRGLPVNMEYSIK